MLQVRRSSRSNGAGSRDNDIGWNAMPERIRRDSEGGRTRIRACQLIQFFSGIEERKELLLGAFADCGAGFLEIPAFKAILFRALLGDVPRVKTCRHTLFPPEAAGIQRYVSAPARNTGTFPCTDESR